MSGVVEVPEFLEPAPVQDDFIQGIAWIEKLGPCVRVAYYVEQSLPELGGALVKVIVRKVVIPIDALLSVNCQVRKFLERDTADNVVRFPIPWTAS